MHCTSCLHMLHAAELLHVLRCDGTHRMCLCTTSLLFVSRQWALTWNNFPPFEHDMSLFTLVFACASPASANHITLSNFFYCSKGCSHDTTQHLSGAQIPESTMLCTTTPYVSMSFHAACPGVSKPHFISLLPRSFFLHAPLKPSLFPSSPKFMHILLLRLFLLLLPKKQS